MTNPPALDRTTLDRRLAEALAKALIAAVRSEDARQPAAPQPKENGRTEAA
jgi:hypothetical protein